MNLRLDLVLLTPAWCSHCSVDFESGDLVASFAVGNVFFCLACANGMLEAERDAWEPAHEHAEPAVAVLDAPRTHRTHRISALGDAAGPARGPSPAPTPERIGSILQRTSVALLLNAHHAHVDHAFDRLAHDSTATIAPEPTGLSVRPTT